MAQPLNAPFSGRALHFIGIGGAGMSGLALVAKQLAPTVTGSDQAESSYCVRLREAGIEPVIGHDAANLPEGAEVVVSTAIPDDNPELAAARGAGATVLHRGDLLGELSRMKRTIAVGGTHGKTTTASMAALALLESGREPAFLIGGELRAAATNAAWGAGEWAVIEADESDRSFLALGRDIAVVTNVELDHHATYANLGELEDAFEEFAAPGGREGAGSRSGAAGRRRRRDLRHQRRGAADPHCRRLAVRGGWGRVEPPGSRRAQRPQCSRGTGGGGRSGRAARRGRARPREVHGRRPPLRGARPHAATGAQVFDDYAHHPTEVRATLAAARTLEPRRLIAAFQPHLYSRTRMLARDFGQALALADLIVVLDVYRARERPEDFPGVSGFLIAQSAADAAAGRPVWWMPRLEDAERSLRSELSEGDLLLTLGAGNVDELARRLAA